MDEFDDGNWGTRHLQEKVHPIFPFRGSGSRCVPYVLVATANTGQSRALPNSCTSMTFNGLSFAITALLNCLSGIHFWSVDSV